MNQNYVRWIWASLTKHFNTYKQTLRMYVEGHDLIRDDEDHFEFRLNGPDFHEVSKNYFIVNFNINILITSIKDDQDAHKLVRNQGIVLAAFLSSIPIYKYGDDNALLECAKLLSEVIITNFGLVQPTNNIMQSTVEGSYELILS